MSFDFNTPISRKNTNAMSLLGYRDYLFTETDAFDSDYSDTDLIPMWIADMEFKSPPAVIDAIKERADHGIFGYSQIFDQEFKTIFLRWSEKRYDWHFNTEHLVFSAGVIPALFNLTKHCCAKDENVLIFTPSYAFFKLAADRGGNTLVTSDLRHVDGRYEIDFEDFEEKAKDPKTTLCIFCNPHNPTGRVWSVEELRRVGEIALENGLRILSDEIHCDLLRVGQTFTPLAKLFPDSDLIITCMAASKTFNMAGFMLAQTIIPEDSLRNTWLKSELPVQNPLSIVAVQAAYANGAEWLDALRSYLDGNFSFVASYLKKYLPEAKFRIAEATNLAWVNVEAYLPNEENLTLFFANKAGVLLEGGNMFVSNGDGYIRLNLACPRVQVEKCLERIAKVLLGH